MKARIMALAALLLSGAAHGLVFSGLGAPSADPAGGGEGGAEVPLIGNDFADLAVGQAVPVGVQTATPVTAPVAPPVAAPLEAVDAVEPVTPDLAPPRAVVALPVAPPELAAPVAPTDELTAAPDVAPEPSPRPVARPMPPPSAPPKTAAKIAPKAAVTPPRGAAATGNADRQGAKGSASGTASGTGAKAQGAEGGAGSAKALSPARYGAAVIKRIRATPQHGAGGRGKALVGFEIGASGTLASVRILRSSGSAALDKAALDHIRRAAPFPPPPAAPARFSFEFIAKG